MIKIIFWIFRHNSEILKEMSFHGLKIMKMFACGALFLFFRKTKLLKIIVSKKQSCPNSAKNRDQNFPGWSNTD